ncbi:ATP-dependent DNA helicase DinG [Paenibacillus contaminans]|uniref:3'-5' exonuclease DinG n=1 Tax=Paenibacillus contaminans TaxID=450362 RepID=A0A329MGG2_9BACL|nr:ATP-dependent DNA helicase DinG [Paenibacillus contaminans]RAV18486.1 ATP-dependent helicase DinG [Paenibacillus contaminans]
MKFAVLDFETTGTQPGDEIIQVGLVIIENRQITDRYTSLVKPGIRIPSYICSLTGINDDMVADAPPIEDVIGEMQRRLQNSILVAHNVGFDLGFLQRALDLSGYSSFDGRVLDTTELLRICFPALPSLKLSMVCQSLDIMHDRPHQADSDALATAEVWLKCLQRFDELPLVAVQRIAQIFDDDPSDLGWFMNELLIRKEQSPTLERDSYRYHRQFALNVDDWGDEEPVRNDTEASALSKMDFADFYNNFKESLRAKFEVYEDRESQDLMIKEVNESFDKERHLMIEAGTGTGKSLGYLLPSLFYGIKEDKKVLVSTHTINLQEQLRQRDVPLLHDIFPVPFRAAVLKGRSHYLCLRKFEQKIVTHDFEYGKEERMTAAQMIVWLSDTKHGDDEELHFTGRGNDLWGTVSSDADSCLNRACPWFKKCFYHRARNEANIADVVITNHSMLFTDIVAENRLLPSYKHLVIDEAHHFEDVASKHLGIEAQYMGFVGALTWLYKDSKTGQLPLLKVRLSRADGELAEKAAEWSKLIDDTYSALVQVKEHWDQLTLQLYELLIKQHDSSSAEAGQLVWRIKDETLPAQWEQLQEIEDNIYTGLSDSLKKIEKMLATLKELQDELDVQGLVTDLNGTVKTLYKQRDAMRFFMKRTDANYVYWLEASATYKAKSLQLVCVPTDVSDMLQQYFFNVKDSIILTSATLSVDKKFDYTAEQLGLRTDREDRLKTVMLPSPFNYRKQALVVIPRDFPTIKGQTGDAVFLEKLVESLGDVALQTNGRMLVLFTSYKMLKVVHGLLKERLTPDNIQVLGQGIDSSNRSKLTRMFQESPSAVLLGTSSFWEGVDIPGDALSCLAIVRLPFQPPTHPVVEAKCENIKKANQNPFMKLSVPQAVIRFKQGFGRLVRTANDRGIVIIYDTRVLETHYGKYFLYSLPGPKIEHMNTNRLVPRIKDWMEEEHR